MSDKIEMMIENSNKYNLLADDFIMEKELN